jgi:nitrogen-specific signal transduction histidine kinase
VQGEQHIESAIAELEQLLRKNPKDVLSKVALLDRGTLLPRQLTRVAIIELRAYAFLGKYQPDFVALAQHAVSTCVANEWYPDVIHAYNALGIHFAGSRKNNEALSALFTAKELAENDAEPLLLSQVLNNIGNVYLLMADPAMAAVYYEHVVTTNQTTNLTVQQAITLKNLGSIYHLHFNNYELSTPLFLRALSIFEAHNDTVGILLCTQSLASSAFGNGDHNMAKHYALATIRLGTPIESERTVFNAIITYAQVCEQQQDIRGIQSLIDIVDSSLYLERAYPGLQQCLQGVQHVLLEEYRLAATCLDNAKTALHEKLDTLQGSWLLSMHAQALAITPETKKVLELILQAESERLKLQQLVSSRSIRHALLQQQHSLQSEQQPLTSSSVQYVAHELRTPLSNIRTIASLLQNHDVNAADTSELTEHIRTIADDALTFISQQLVPHIQRGKNNIVVVLQRVLASTRFTAIAKGTRIREYIPHEPVFVDVGAAQLTSIIQNLVSNALKFAPLNGNVIVRIVVEDNAAAFEIEDNGPGLTEEEVATVFNPFVTHDSKPTGGEHTSGLGLHFVATLVADAHGSIECLKGALGGALFRVKLPISSPK